MTYIQLQNTCTGLNSLLLTIKLRRRNGYVAGLHSSNMTFGSPMRSKVSIACARDIIRRRRSAIGATSHPSNVAATSQCHPSIVTATSLLHVRNALLGHHMHAYVRIHLADISDVRVARGPVYWPVAPNVLSMHIWNCNVQRQQ